MAEDDEKVEDKTEDGDNTNDEVEYTEVERQAMERGWDPNFEGDENKRAISAEEFLDRQKLYDDLRKRGNENKRLQKAVDELRESHKVVAQQAYKRAKRELEKEKREAYEEGDTNRALEIDKEMSELDEDQKKVASSGDEVDQQQYAEVFENFKAENPWYEKDPELRWYADMIGGGMINMNPEKAQSDPDTFFQEVAAEVRRRFPDKFKGEERSGKRGGSSNAVEGDRGSGGKGGKKRTLKDLPEEHREVAKRVIETGVMNEEDYVKDYFGES